MSEESVKCKPTPARIFRDKVREALSKTLEENGYYPLDVLYIESIPEFDEPIKEIRFFPFKKQIVDGREISLNEAYWRATIDDNLEPDDFGRRFRTEEHEFCQVSGIFKDGGGPGRTGGEMIVEYKVFNDSKFDGDYKGEIMSSYRISRYLNIAKNGENVFVQSKR